MDDLRKGDLVALRCDLNLTFYDKDELGDQQVTIPEHTRGVIHSVTRAIDGSPIYEVSFMGGEGTAWYGLTWAVVPEEVVLICPEGFSEIPRDRFGSWDGCETCSEQLNCLAKT